MQVQGELKRITIRPLFFALALAAALLLAMSAGYWLRAASDRVAPSSPSAAQRSTLIVADRNEEPSPPPLHDGILKPQR
jgi:hypothetical protein